MSKRVRKEPDDEPGIGHNSEVGGVAADRLRSIIERIERLEEERKALQADIKDIFHEAKSAGFDTAAVRAILKIRKMEPAVREERRTLVETYAKALGIYDDGDGL